MGNEESTAGDGRIKREPSRRTTPGLPGRRTYLKGIGAYVAGRVMIGVSGRTRAAKHTTHEVDAGGTFEKRVRSDETFENALVDVSAENAGFDIVATGSDWTIRNVGISGTNGSEAAGSAFRLQVAKGSSGTFENVYIGDGAVDGDNAGVFVPTAHAGTLTIRRCHVAGWPDNGIYASAPGREERNGQGGIVRIVDSYAYNNNIAGFRLGTDGSSIERSVVHVESDVPNNAAGKENARGIWVKEGGTVDIENCDVLLAHPDGTNCVIESDDGSEGLARVRNSSVAARADAERFYGNVTTSDVDDDPDVTPPASVPESAEAAVRGQDERGGADDESGEADDGSGETSDAGNRKSIVVAGGDRNEGKVIDYTLEADGDLAGTVAAEDDETVTDGRVDGLTDGSRDAFALDGAITSFEATLTDDEDRPRARVVITADGDRSRVRFEGGSDDDLLEYRLEVTGSVTATPSVEEESGVSERSARGATGGAADELSFTGEIVSLRAAFPPDGERFLVAVKPGR
jgi:hypothetical protein